uniref:ATP synthase complex subunit 8 n=2 Tax=Stenocatantops TaxID=227616 RepID=A0A481MVP0_9ORTH|nr:ATP synthase F0 subunit 8 [Stenocatantops splendens]YP_009988389.1 ATP synthase F0 subunit 8 [Stenocatantops mistshenkoi]QAU54122.1 ATP synthase F0 subunit 8 [Stenocatantops splendens]QID03814.1 ATP synthase F0 subunit 8 [Stenocatantops splendens]QNM39688.1 ATP synthase F0 subunit 8 [Stenocatantops mistshenkoi]QON98859.1 ATP synthase F0 subunit 8 [Stenocatantops mistshenkoi]QON98872.1 ATP synthase F0 subunit 8 [Stenocatantops splendens]
MPQMSPLMWFSLFILFSFVLILFNQMNFFSFKPLIIKSAEKGEIEKKNLIWKW